MYTFDTALVSDLHKDAYGHRPSAEFMDMWNNGLSDEGRQAEWDYLVGVMKASIEQEKEEEQIALEEFEKELAQILKINPRLTEAEALAYMTPIEFEDNTNLNSQDVEHWVWQNGILFTERGRQIVEMVKQIHGVK